MAARFDRDLLARINLREYRNGVGRIAYYSPLEAVRWLDIHCCAASHARTLGVTAFCASWLTVVF
jgi:hypothetical protein